MLLNPVRALAVATIVAVLPPAVLLAQTPAPTPAPVPVATSAPDLADGLFDDTLLHDILLTCSSRDWASLKEHYLDNTYYPCNLQWNGQIVRSVGIRSRGTGSRSGVKPGLRVDFDRYSTDQKFLGLKSLILRNNTQDPSGLRERLSMLVFRRMGVKAEREAHARLFVNNTYVGLYTIVESIDKTWLEKNYGENDGYLYEFKFDNAAERPFVFRYLGADPDAYVPVPFKPETHEADPHAEVMERFIWTVDVAGDAAWRSSMAEFLDLNAFVKRLAIENFIAEEDGLTGDYGPNNAYFYRFQNANTIVVIPWDKSNTFWQPDYSIFRNIDDGPPDRRNRLVTRALAYTDLRELYLDTMLQCAESVLSGATDDTPGWLETEVSREFDQVRSASLTDVVKPYSNDEFEASIDDLLAFARTRAAIVRDQVAADRVRRRIR